MSSLPFPTLLRFLSWYAITFWLHMHKAIVSFSGSLEEASDAGSNHVNASLSKTTSKFIS